MATARKLELNALLNPIQKTVSGITSSVPSMRSIVPSMPTGEASGLGQMLFSFSLVLIILFIILLVIHYTITPIFSFRGGDGGLIPLANTSDGQLVWTKGPPTADLSANVQRILPLGFTVQQDIYMDNESALSNRRRIFFYRSNTPVVVPTPTAPENLITDYPNSNLFMYLSPNTNDMIITAITKRGNNDYVLESAPTILNVPIKEVVRITVVLLPELMEVYFNGKLHGTRTFRFTPISTDTYFFSTPDAFRNSVRVMNFKYWDRPLSAMEIKNSSPPLADKSLFNPAEMAGTC
jgi:hypothetical protein